MKRQMLLYLVLALLPACAANDVTTKRIPFPETEYAALKTKGSGVVSGQVFLETRWGEKVPKAGAKVVLNPVTSYSTQWYQAKTAVLKQELESPDPRIAGFVREAVTDAEGRFEIAGVPAGDYYLSSPLVWVGPWHVNTVYPMVPQGRYLAKQITVHDKEQVDVSLKCAIRLDEDSIDVSQPSSEKMPLWASLNY